MVVINLVLLPTILEELGRMHHEIEGLDNLSLRDVCELVVLELRYFADVRRYLLENGPYP